MFKEIRIAGAKGYVALIALVGVVVLSACGGGSGTPASTPTDLEQATALYGIEPGGVGGDAGGDGGAAGGAGDGAPLKRAVVTLTDAKGNQVSGFTDNNGRYLLKYQTKNFTPPLVVRVIDAGGNILSSVTEESAAAGKVVLASVNPLTDKITSDVLPLSVAGTDKFFNGSKIDVTKLTKAKADLVTSINAALGVAGVADTSKFDAVKSIYNYDGNGVDAVIESISHVRDASTGATQLRAKLVSLETNADGTVNPTLITASTPLSTASVAISSNPALTFNKVNAWVNEMNRCFAMTSTARNADVDCADADGSRLVDSAFKNNSKDFRETYRTLFSEADGSAVQGSTLRNPQVLYMTRSTGSAVDNIAVVEFTFNQPRSGPKGGSVTTAMEYTASIVFRRNDGLTRAKAVNWIAYGSQRNFDFTIKSRNAQNIQINLQRDVNAQGGAPSNYQSLVNLTVPASRYNIATQAYESANLRAVRIKGPGLPSNGVVLAPTTLAGSETYLTLVNKTGSVGTSPMINSNGQTSYILNTVAGDGSPIYAGFWNPSNVAHPDTPFTDFASLQAYNVYTAEIFLNSNPSNTTPDAVETTRIQAAIMAPASYINAQRNDLSPSRALVTAPANGGCSFTISWVNNPNASAINNTYIYGSRYNPSISKNDQAIINAGVNASLVGTRQSSVQATASNCTTGAIPALGSNPPGMWDYREIGIRSSQARADYYTVWMWNNN